MTDERTDSYEQRVVRGEEEIGKRRTNDLRHPDLVSELLLRVEKVRSRRKGEKERKERIKMKFKVRLLRGIHLHESAKRERQADS